jgi:hypothetical protein
MYKEILKCILPTGNNPSKTPKRLYNQEDNIFLNGNKTINLLIKLLTKWRFVEECGGFLYIFTA